MQRTYTFLFTLKSYYHRRVISSLLACIPLLNAAVAWGTHALLLLLRMVIPKMLFGVMGYKPQLIMPKSTNEFKCCETPSGVITVQ